MGVKLSHLPHAKAWTTFNAITGEASPNDGAIAFLKSYDYVRSDAQIKAAAKWFPSGAMSVIYVGNLGFRGRFIG